MKKGIKTAITIVVSSLVAIGMAAYLINTSYVASNLDHYIGESVITPVQLVSMFSESPGLIHDYSTQIEVLDDGSVKIAYDFYSSSEISYLTKTERSFWEAPAIYYIISLIKETAIHIVSTIIIITLIVILIDWLQRKHPTTPGHIFANIIWYFFHPRYIFSKSGPPPRHYPAQTVDSIEVSSKCSGILCTRTWKYKSGYLYSAGIGQAKWETKTLIANRLPESENGSGVYACRIGVIGYHTEFSENILGIVSMEGDWYEHGDGVIRAEKCDILQLIVSEYYSKIAGELGALYGVPIMVASNPVNAYQKWAVSSKGIACLQHNLEILREDTNYGNNGAGHKKGESTIQKTSRRTRVKTKASSGA